MLNGKFRVTHTIQQTGSFELQGSASGHFMPLKQAQYQKRDGSGAYQAAAQNSYAQQKPIAKQAQSVLLSRNASPTKQQHSINFYPVRTSINNGSQKSLVPPAQNDVALNKGHYYHQGSTRA